MAGRCEQVRLPVVGIRRRRWFVLLICFVGITSFGQSSAVLRTRSTILELQADALEPRIVSLRSTTSTTWINSVPESLISQVDVNGKLVPLTWRLDPKASVRDRSHVRFVYVSREPHLRLSWEWAARGDVGPIEHTIHIENLSGQEIWIPLQDSLRAKFQLSNNEPLKHLYVEKGADTPSPEGTHYVTVNSDYNWRGYSSTYAHPVPGQPREIIPLSLVERGDSAQSGWYLGIEFSGRTTISLKRDAGSLRVVAGLNPEPGPFRTRLRAGETFDTPPIFLGAFTGGYDEAGNTLRRWVRQVLGNPETWRNTTYPTTVNNSWGSGLDINEAIALRMIHQSAELGLEMFGMDAGWFRAVGDWHPDPKKFPHGLKPISDAAHQAGLKFGIWVDWAQAGLSTAPGALNVNDPIVKDWSVSDLPPDWKPEGFKGETIDISVPAAKQWASREVDRIVKDYGLDMLEHDGYLVAQGCIRNDHPHAPPDPDHLWVQKDSGFHFVYSSNSTDVSYHSTRAYYDIQSHLRKQNRGLLLEICNDGGRMVDFGSASHGDYFSITDTYDPLSNRRAFYDTSHVLPPAMLESYVEKWPAPTIENFRYMLRSGMMGWLSIMQDTTAWSEQQRQVAKDEIAFYKTQLRPLIRHADLYHVSERPDGVHWDALEYFDPQGKVGVAYVFRGSSESESTHAFSLHGLNEDRSYRVRFRDRSSPDFTAKGKDLASGGLHVRLAIPNSSEIVEFSEVAQ